MSLFRMTTARFRPRARKARSTASKSFSVKSRSAFSPMKGSTFLPKLRLNSALPSCRATPSFSHSSKRSATVKFSVALRSASAMTASLAACSLILFAFFSTEGLMPSATFWRARSRSVRMLAIPVSGNVPH
ncbi:hypothetical protein D3C81_1506100 [compost metagenome]